jgi:cytochrome c554/c'-like protein
MRHIPGRLLMVTAVAGVACLAWPRSPVASGFAEVAAPAAEDHGWNAAADRESAWMGVASCASSSCHHMNGPKGSARSEYDTWAGYDKHSRAFQVLYDERSQRIARNLYGDGAKATEQALCLKCHASHDGVTDKGVSDRFQLADGVGCESCHGAAEKWLPIHYSDEFKGKSIDEKAALGLRPTKDILHRAKLCTTCHVGTAEKEVNHDLIAAGHPRLAFELGAYHGIANKHWDVRKDHQKYPDFEARLWEIGQVVSTRAALALLKSRADGANKEGKEARPWPEFSEYDCFACHKSLQVNSPRQEAGYPGRRPGSFPYGTWYLTLTEALGRQTGAKIGNGDVSIASLRRVMQSPSPDPILASKQAAALSGSLDSWLGEILAEKTLGPNKVDSLLTGLARDGVTRADSMDWDQATQLYLSLAALQESRNDLTGKGADLLPKLEAVRERLRRAFPKDIDSPKNFDPLALPPLRQQLDAIATQLGN